MAKSISTYHWTLNKLRAEEKVLLAQIDSTREQIQARLEKVQGEIVDEEAGLASLLAVRVSVASALRARIAPCAVTGLKGRCTTLVSKVNSWEKGTNHTPATEASLTALVVSLETAAAAK